MRMIILAVSLASAGVAQAHPLEDDAAMQEGMSQATPAATLQSYRAALEAADASRMTPLFTADSVVFENGKFEGSWADYLENHLGPELGHFESFTYSDPTIEVRMMGDHARAYETYGYVIMLTDGRRIERTGVATSVLTREPDGKWRIASYHSSSRAPRPAQ